MPERNSSNLPGWVGCGELEHSDTSKMVTSPVFLCTHSQTSEGTFLRRLVSRRSLARSKQLSENMDWKLLISHSLCSLCKLSSSSSLLSTPSHSNRKNKGVFRKSQKMMRQGCFDARKKFLESTQIISRAQII